MLSFRIILILIWSLSAFASSNLEQIKLKWIGAFDIKINESLKPLEEINQPQNTWIEVGEVHYFDKNFSTKTDCILYNTPGKSSLGELKIIEKPMRKSCQDLIFEEGLYQAKNIRKLGYQLKGNTFSLIVDNYNIEFKYYNQLKNSKFQLNKNRGSFSSQSVALVTLSSKDDGTILKSGQLCFQIDDQCNIVKKDECRLCPNQVVAIKENNCSRLYSKICSDNPCGSRGQYACLRGQEFIGELKDYCLADSPIGYCQKGLRVFCENKRLICR